MRFSIPSILVAMAILGGLPHATAEDVQVRYITLFNHGGYNVDPIVLHWKTSDGVKESKQLGAKIGKGEAICYDITKGGVVPDGAEVWILAKIEVGDNENCRKSDKRVYNASSKRIWWLDMGGTTLNNNRCKNVSKKNQWYPASVPIKGNSDACG